MGECMRKDENRKSQEDRETKGHRVGRKRHQLEKRRPDQSIPYARLTSKKMGGEG